MNENEALIKFTDIWEAANIGKSIEEVVDDIENLKASPAAPNEETGVAVSGGLLLHTLMTYHFAVKLNTMLSSVFQINTESLAKVCVLFQIGKIGMFEPNDNTWQIQNQGKVYKFKELGAVLKTGERSHLLCSNKGITFTPEEREAMTIVDKTGEEFEKMNLFISPISRILRLANDLAFSVERERWRKRHFSE